MKKLLKMPAIVLQCKSFSTTCSRNQNSIHNASVLTNFLSGVLNSQPNFKQKLPGDLQDAKYLFVVGSEFREEFLRVQPKCDLVGVQDHAYSFRNAQNREVVAQCLQLVAKKKRETKIFLM
jgi:hypothetical protein